MLPQRVFFFLPWPGLHTATATAQGHSDDVCLTVFLPLALGLARRAATHDLLFFN